MPVLGLGRSESDGANRYGSRVEDGLLAGDSYLPSQAATARVSFDDVNRRTCSSVDCTGGWVRPWRNRRRPVFEGQWGCSGRCVQALVRTAVRRETGDLRTGPEGSHRHRVPLGLVMLAQGWITNPQLQAALKSQRASGSGRIGDWLIAECGLDAELVTRGLSVQWSCPVLSTDGFSALEMALVMPLQFVAEFGLVPLRVAGQRMLYLGSEERLNASVAYAVEQMSGLKVESGLVDGPSLASARTRLLAEAGVPVKVEGVEDEDAMVAHVTAALEHRQPLASRLVRVHQYFWLRMWLESGTKGLAGTLPRSGEDMQDYIFTPARRD